MRRQKSRNQKTEHRQWPMVILWIILLLAALFPARYINSMYGYAAFFFLLFLGILALIVLTVQSRQIEVTAGGMEKGQTACLRGEAVDLKLGIKNRSIFVCPWAHTEFFVSDLFGDTDSLLDVDFTIAARSVSEFPFSVDMKHIGVYQVGVKQVRLKDMFGMFERKIPLNGMYEVFVKPRIYVLEDLDVEEQLSLDANEERKNAVPNGMDYAGVREYTEGDPMKQIHWKLSAHTVNYMTKISENSCQSDVSLILDTAAQPAESEELMDLYDALLETAFSILEVLKRQDVGYSLIYCDRKNQVRRSIPKGGESDMEYIRRFHSIEAEPSADYPDGAFLVEQESGMQNRSANLIVCTSCVTSELIQQLLKVKRQHRQPELYVIYPKRLVQREREELMMPLRMLDEAGIPWHPVSTGYRQNRTEVKR